MQRTELVRRLKKDGGVSMKYVYPAIFTPLENDSGYDVYVPDLPYVRTFGNSLAEAMEMAEDATAMWLAHTEDAGQPIPPPPSR